jgi:hypothetical protein
METIMKSKDNSQGSRDKPAAATNIKKAAVLVRKALVTGNLLDALYTLQRIVRAAMELKQSIITDASVISAVENSAHHEAVELRVKQALAADKQKTAVA